MGYIDCPHCGKRHISHENVELCRKYWENIAFLEQWAARQQPQGVFHAKLGDIMWDTIREAVMQRVGHRCELCGVSPMKLGVRFEVHHKQPRSQGGSHHPKNLQLLCIKCHHFVHSRHGKVADSLQQQLQVEEYP